MRRITTWSFCWTAAESQQELPLAWPGVAWERSFGTRTSVQERIVSVVHSPQAARSLDERSFKA